MLIDEKGTTAAQYSVSGYPHTYLIDRGGRVALDRHGAISEAELEREIQQALRGQAMRDALGVRHKFAARGVPVLEPKRC